MTQDLINLIKKIKNIIINLIIIILKINILMVIIIIKNSHLIIINMDLRATEKNMIMNLV
jgi:hypothetical protein